MITAPRAIALLSPDPVTRVLAQLACLVTETPWLLGPQDLAAARAAGMSDETTLQVVLLSSFFGHLNRVADAVGIDLDYRVVLAPLRADPATPCYARPTESEWPDEAGRRALDASMRPGAAEGLAAWRAHALLRDAPLDRRQRALIAQAVAERLGDRAGLSAVTTAPASSLDEALIQTADEVTLAPWRLGAGTVARLRAAGLSEDVAVFDAIATATACTTFSRIQVALAALGA